MVVAKVAEGPINKITREKTVTEIRTMKPGMANGPFEIYAEITSACGKVGISLKTELCQSVLDKKRMQDKWRKSVSVPTFKELGDVRNCNSFRVEN